MTSRQVEIYTCETCGKEAEGQEFEGNGPKNWLPLEHWGDSAFAMRVGDFCSEECCCNWLAPRTKEAAA